VSRRKPLAELLVSSGLVRDRRLAQSLIMQGRVLVNGKPVTGPNSSVCVDAALQLIEERCPYVSRGGLKLKNCLNVLGDSAPPIPGRVCLDIGSSTGGFTEVLLEAGAARVYAVDVGKGLLDGRLRSDPRIVVLEGVNARQLSRQQVPELCEVLTADVSFTSGVRLLPSVLPLLARDAEGLLLLKPQFERTPDPEDERKGWFAAGVVKHPELHRRVLQEAYTRLCGMGLPVAAIVPASPLGARGNQEFFLHLRRSRPGLDALAFQKRVGELLSARAGGG